MFKVISEFVDKRSGARVLPGDPLPQGLPEETLTHLQRARCIKPAPAQASLLGASKTKPAVAPSKKPVAKPAAAEGGPGQAAFLPAEDGAGAATLAGGDGGDPGQRAEPGGGGRGKGRG